MSACIHVIFSPTPPHDLGLHSCCKWCFVLAVNHCAACIACQGGHFTIMREFGTGHSCFRSFRSPFCHDNVAKQLSHANIKNLTPISRQPLLVIVCAINNAWPPAAGWDCCWHKIFRQRTSLLSLLYMLATWHCKENTTRHVTIKFFLTALNAI